MSRAVRPRSMRPKTLLVIPLLVVLASLAAPALVQRAAAQDVEAPAGAQDDAEAAAICDPVTQPADELLEVGDSAVVGPMEVTITETSFQRTIDDFFDEGYLRVDFVATNQSDETADFDAYHGFELLDLQPSGVIPSPLDGASTTNTVSLAPGETLEGYVLFPVGYAGGEYRVQYEFDFFGEEGNATWAVELGASEGGPPAPEPGVVDPSAVIPQPEVGDFENVRSYDIDIEIRSDGTVAFDETIEYDFGPYQRHGIYRDMILRERCDEVYDRVYPISDIEVDSESGAPAGFVVEDAPAGKRIKIGDPDEYVTGVHTYEVGYVLDGTMNAFEDHDELYWDVIGTGWGVQLSNVDITVTAPAPIEQVACFSGEAGSRATCNTAEIVDGEAHFVEDRLYPGSGMTIAVGLPKGVIDPEPAPILEERWSLVRAFSLTPATMGGAFLLLVGLVGGWSLVAYRVGRDRQLAGSPIDAAFAPVDTTSAASRVPLGGGGIETPVQFEPPDGIRPAQLAMLRNEEARPLDVSATIIDLAVRGWLRIEEIPDSGGFFKKDDYKIVRVRDDLSGLVEYERQLITSLVPGREIELSDVRQKFSSKLLKILSEVYDDSVSRGWFGRRPDKVRGRWRALGILALLVSVAITVALAMWTKLALLGIPIIVASFVVIFSAGKMPARTPAGTGMLRRVKGFEIFITDSEAPRARWAENRNIFSEYLPYAIVLGCATRWARTFEDLGDQAMGETGWYVGHQPLTVHVMSTELTSFATSTGSTLASTPPSSSSGGGGGFSGGSSGGGGGGGGGGSW